MPSDRFKAVAPWVKGLRPGRLGEFSVDAAADDLLGLLNANGVESMGLVGSGLGGVVALAAAQRAPECVSELVLEGVNPKFGRLALGAQKTLIRAMPEARWASTGLNRASVLAVLDGLAGLDLASGLPTVAARTLVLVGAQDRALRPAADAIAAGVAGARLAVVPQAADPVHLSAPEAFSAELWSFLGAE
jgi:pimeloyl-ACP methyl ester carboxylesterase